MFKAIALGAEYCWVGRPIFWGLAVSDLSDLGTVFKTFAKDILTQYNGEEGVKLMLDTYQKEFKHCMQLCGCNSVKDITKSCLAVFKSDGPLARL